MGGSIFIFLESKTFEFSMEEGGSFYLLRIFERYKDSPRSVFMGKESALRLLSYIEDLMSNTRPENFTVLMSMHMEAWWVGNAYTYPREVESS